VVHQSFCFWLGVVVSEVLHAEFVEVRRCSFIFVVNSILKSVCGSVSFGLYSMSAARL